ncbi:MAG: hypothetical protein GF330_14615 [Candidatus Eisenbacteria bacterium]|nr:hypothetical protein [Candidatus Eisenbacteria bacterium]
MPCAISFYHLDLQRLAPRGFRARDWIDAEFVRLPASREERELETWALPQAADTRIGNPSQMATYDRWRYRPEQPSLRNPLARAGSL